MEATVPRRPATVVAVLGGRGGAGASTLAAGLAVTATARGRKVLLVDADPLGGGLDLLLGCEDYIGPRWPQLPPAGEDSPATWLGSLPHPGGLALLSCARHAQPPIPPQAMATALQVGRGCRDLVVVDLPRWADPAAKVVLQTADVCLLVVPAQVQAVAAARRVVATAAAAWCQEVRLVVRAAPGGMAAQQVADTLQLPLAGHARHDHGLAATAEAGQPPAATGRGPLAALCRRLVDQLCPHPDPVQGS